MDRGKEVIMFLRRWIIAVFAALFMLVSALFVVQAQDDHTTQYIHTSRTARVRTCPEVSCEVIAHLPDGAAIEVVESVHGDTIGGSAEWEHVIVEGEHGYVHGSLTSEVAPAHSDTSVPPHNPSSEPVPHTPIHH